MTFDKQAYLDQMALWQDLKYIQLPVTNLTDVMIVTYKGKTVGKVPFTTIPFGNAYKDTPFYPYDSNESENEQSAEDTEEEPYI